jgi:hypothetical protein
MASLFNTTGCMEAELLVRSTKAFIAADAAD